MKQDQNANEITEMTDINTGSDIVMNSANINIHELFQEEQY